MNLVVKQREGGSGPVSCEPRSCSGDPLQLRSSSEEAKVSVVLDIQLRAEFIAVEGQLDSGDSKVTTKDVRLAACCGP